MKRILGILGLFIIIISAFTPFAVKADVLWEPQKDFSEKTIYLRPLREDII